MSSIRQKALAEFSIHEAQRFHKDDRPVSAYFGCNVFDSHKMEKYLSKETFKKVSEAISEGKKIDRSIANEVAEGMKNWAVEMGATHYTHLFNPLTDSTAEKHEAFISKTKMGEPFENFKGSALVQQEPDASSFPSGGMRSTFEARGYSAWDPSSPAFILDQTLCIPTIFVSYTGQALDMKIPHLKSLQALDKAATSVVNLFDPDVKKVSVNLGLEQEYFLVDDALYEARPDLQICDRTLMGHTAAKDQQLDDHYFGAIPQRVLDYMKDFETEAYKLGIMLKTRHNEVAPNQFECAPEFCEANLAVDQNNLLMILMRKIASRHHLRVIFHEKPFAGVNGSGKHCNWSMCTDKGTNLLSPSATPGRNLQFLSVLVSVLRGVYKHHYLMMAGVASLNNFYRLGGNEAPPAIMSVFIGSTIDKVLNEIESLGTAENDQATELAKLDIVNKIPEILPDNTDRNRTSPFAFTGNRFEFRAVGSSVNVASADYILNTIVAEQLTLFRQRVDTYIQSGVEKQEAIMKVIREFIVESKPIRFEGNGYSDEWRKEAAARGLRGINDVPEAYDELVISETVEMFDSQGVLSREEIEARREVLDENFTKKLQIESRVMCDLTINHIIPTAIKYQNVLLKNVQMMKDVLGDSEEAFKESAQPNIDTIKKISGYIGVMHQGVHDMVEARKEGNKIEDYVKKAHVYSKTVLPYMDVIRDKADKLEMIVDDELWPLPKYRELQFLK